MSCVNICCHCSLQELPQGWTVIGEGLHSSPTPPTTAAAMMVVVMVVLPSIRCTATPRRVGARDTWGSHGTASQDVRQNGCTLHILHQQRYHVGELRLPQGVAQGTGPVDIIDCRMGVLQHQVSI